MPVQKKARTQPNPPEPFRQERIARKPKKKYSDSYIKKMAAREQKQLEKSSPRKNSPRPKKGLGIGAGIRAGAKPKKK